MYNKNLIKLMYHWLNMYNKNDLMICSYDKQKLVKILTKH